MGRPVQIGVIGGSVAAAAVCRLAEAAGAEIARRGATVICGGRGGVMEAAARGAAAAGGLSVGILPTYDWQTANPYLSVVLPTGLGHARNAVVVAACDAVIALDGAHGTLAEIALARKLGRPVVGLRAWHHLEGVTPAEEPAAAVEAALARVAGLGAG